MNKQILVALVLLSQLTGIQGMAATKKASNHAQLGTSFRFNPNALHGKRQVSPNLTATVENDKYLDDLLGPRRSFKDRLEQDKQRN